jgi:hypothetical protein
MKCPHCGKKINAASIMGAAGKGKPKDFSNEERKLRSERMKALNAKRRAESQNVKMQTTPETKP